MRERRVLSLSSTSFGDDRTAVKIRGYICVYIPARELMRDGRLYARASAALIIVWPGAANYFPALRKRRESENDWHEMCTCVCVYIYIYVRRWFFFLFGSVLWGEECDEGRCGEGNDTIFLGRDVGLVVRNRRDEALLKFLIFTHRHSV